MGKKARARAHMRCAHKVVLTLGAAQGRKDQGRTDLGDLAQG